MDDEPVRGLGRPLYPMIVDELVTTHTQILDGKEWIGICMQQWAGSSRNVPLCAAVQLSNNVNRRHDIEWTDAGMS